MNQTKIEIKSCENCLFFAFLEGYCNFHKEFTGTWRVDQDYKPDFCKVKNIIVEEE